jgi:hypothetical protein
VAPAAAVRVAAVLAAAELEDVETAAAGLGGALEGDGPVPLLVRTGELVALVVIVKSPAPAPRTTGALCNRDVSSCSIDRLLLGEPHPLLPGSSLPLRCPPPPPTTPPLLTLNTPPVEGEETGVTDEPTA